eukprot:674209-Rhodomonas_salina.4
MGYVSVGLAIGIAEADTIPLRISNVENDRLQCALIRCWTPYAKPGIRDVSTRDCVLHASVDTIPASCSFLPVPLSSTPAYTNTPGSGTVCISTRHYTADVEHATFLVQFQRCDPSNI